MSDYYILDGHTPVACDLMTWARWFDTSSEARVVALTTIDESRVSTVFLSIAHQWAGARLALFETMIFGGPLTDEMDRCSTWDEAEAMHAAMCERVRAASAQEQSK